MLDPFQSEWIAPRKFSTFVRGFILGGARLSPFRSSGINLGLVYQELLQAIPDLSKIRPNWREEIISLVQVMVAQGEITVKGDYSLPASLELRIKVL